MNDLFSNKFSNKKYNRWFYIHRSKYKKTTRWAKDGPSCRTDREESRTIGWKRIWFHLQCSAECGMGVRTRGVVCLTNQVSSLPLEACGSERPATSQVCNNGHCEQRIEWFTGPWSQVRAFMGIYMDLWGCVLLFLFFFFFSLHWIIKWMRPVWPSALQSVAQAASRGQWSAWWGRTRASLSCSLMSARPWSGRSASRAATWRPAEQSGITPTGVG